MLNKNSLADCLHRKRISRLDTLLHIIAVDVDTPKKVQAIKALGRRAGCTEIQKWNVSDILKRSKGLAISLPEGWILASGGREHLQSLGILSTEKSVKVLNHLQQLRAKSEKINNSDTREFINETILAYEVGLYRSSIVLSWVGAVSLLYDNVIKTSLADFNSEAKRRDAKWKDVKIKDDLARMKESDFLDILGSPPISIIGKNLKEELKNSCLKLRNACGHPSSLQIGEHKAAAHIEILILNVFSKFG